ncbi:hypothetical protein [Ferrimicrobium sp.]|uniref:hypothetical protein n=1 Tax=Ferrimicrobium sp. TaxID=2926050 RepID=UPI0026203CDC|nr:hypothetical protein [Ferrimicrobium sp.]
MIELVLFVGALLIAGVFIIVLVDPGFSADEWLKAIVVMAVFPKWSFDLSSQLYRRWKKSHRHGDSRVASAEA